MHRSLVSHLYIHAYCTLHTCVCLCFTAIVVIILIIWYRKRSQEHVGSNTQSSDLNVTASVELEVNPSYGETIRRETQLTTTNYPAVYEELDITANPSYTPFLKGEEVNTLPSKQDGATYLNSTTKGGTQNTGYDYI